MARNRIKLTKGDLVFEVFNTVFMILVFLIIAYPLWFVIIASFSDSQYIASGDLWVWPKGFSFAAYKRVFRNERLLHSYGNTIFYTFTATCLNLVATTALAYPLSRKDFVGRNAIMVFLTITMFFNGGLIPTYLCYKQLGIINTIWCMILPGLVTTYNLILVRTFFQGLPFELQEAAMIDGCSNFRTFLQIILPLSKPIIAVMAIYYGVGHWNAYFNALVYLNDERLKPMSLILREILVTQSDNSDSFANLDSSDVERQRAAEAMKYAVIIVSTAPVLCLYPFLQKHFAKGVMLGAIKG